MENSNSFSIAKIIGDCLFDTMKNDRDFYFFSPDETTSNKLDTIFKEFNRAWNLPIKNWDNNLSSDGRIIEMLSENTLFAVLSGYILSGGRGAMTSYEAFFPIISSQLSQYIKFLRQSREVKWRDDYSALNLLSTSCWQRQDHNGFTHQNPELISALLVKPSNMVNCFFPVDDNSAKATWDWMMQSKNVVNLTTFNKIEIPRRMDYNQARFQVVNRGALVLQNYSDKNPDYIFTAAGDIATREAIEAMKIIRNELPNYKLRFVSIATLSYNAIGTTDNKLTQRDFDEYFTTDKIIFANFHGYSDTLRSILSRYANVKRLRMYGYQDNGSTTTPLDELVRNRCSRFDIAIDFFLLSEHRDLAKRYIDLLAENRNHAIANGIDKIEL